MEGTIPAAATPSIFGSWRGTKVPELSEISEAIDPPPRASLRGGGECAGPRAHARITERTRARAPRTHLHRSGLRSTRARQARCEPRRHSQPSPPLAVSPHPATPTPPRGTFPPALLGSGVAKRRLWPCQARRDTGTGRETKRTHPRPRTPTKGSRSREAAEV